MNHPALCGGALGMTKGLEQGGGDIRHRIRSVSLIVLSHLPQSSGILTVVSTGLISIYIWERGLMEAHKSWKVWNKALTHKYTDNIN